MAFKDKLNEELQINICKALVRLGSFDAACGACSISPRAGHNWMSRGRVQPENSKSKYRAFYDAVCTARLQCAVPVIDSVRKSATGGFVLKPKHVRYTDTLGRVHELPEIEMEADPDNPGKTRPVMIMCELEANVKVGQWWLEKMLPKDFGTKAEIEITETKKVDDATLRVLQNMSRRALPAPAIRGGVP